MMFLLQRLQLRLNEAAVHRFGDWSMKARIDSELQHVMVCCVCPHISVVVWDHMMLQLDCVLPIMPLWEPRVTGVTITSVLFNLHSDYAAEDMCLSHSIPAFVFKHPGLSLSL